jgi:hypothetical protein
VPVTTIPRPTALRTWLSLVLTLHWAVTDTAGGDHIVDNTQSLNPWTPNNWRCVATARMPLRALRRMMVPSRPCPIHAFLIGLIMLAGRSMSLGKLSLSRLSVMLSQFQWKRSSMPWCLASIWRDLHSRLSLPARRCFWSSLTRCLLSGSSASTISIPQKMSPSVCTFRGGLDKLLHQVHCCLFLLMCSCTAS